MKRNQPSTTNTRSYRLRHRGLGQLRRQASRAARRLAAAVGRAGSRAGHRPGARHSARLASCFGWIRQLRAHFRPSSIRLASAAQPAPNATPHLPSAFLDRLIAHTDPRAPTGDPPACQALAGRWLALRRLQSGLAREQIGERTGISATALLLLESGLADPSIVSVDQATALARSLYAGSANQQVDRALAIALGQLDPANAEALAEIEDDLSFTLMRDSALAIRSLRQAPPTEQQRRRRADRLRRPGCRARDRIKTALCSIFTLLFCWVAVAPLARLAWAGWPGGLAPPGAARVAAAVPPAMAFCNLDALCHLFVPPRASANEPSPYSIAGTMPPGTAAEAADRMSERLHDADGLRSAERPTFSPGAICPLGANPAKPPGRDFLVNSGAGRIAALPIPIT
jgi:transcriptional regulator with XRE-family HTH domain